MAEVLLFHHAQGLTPGVVSFADTLRRAGHSVHTPDLFDGRTFDTLEQGMSFVQECGFGELIARGVRAAEGLPAELVYVVAIYGCGAAERPPVRPRSARSDFCTFAKGVGASLGREDRRDQ